MSAHVSVTYCPPPPSLSRGARTSVPPLSPITASALHARTCLPRFPLSVVSRLAGLTHQWLSPTALSARLLRAQPATPYTVVHHCSPHGQGACGQLHHLTSVVFKATYPLQPLLAPSPVALVCQWPPAAVSTATPCANGQSDQAGTLPITPLT
jgi:hypothetical protein